MATVSDIGKTIATVRRGSVIYNFFNTVIVETSNISFIDETNDVSGAGSNIRYVFNASNTAGYGYRALHYTRSYTGDALDVVARPVLYVDSSDTVYGSHYGITAVPVYEAITPSSCKYGDGVSQLSWWSNIDGVLLPDADDQTQYTYDPAKILKFSATSLGDVKPGANCSKIMCTATLHWERLMQINGKSIDTSFWDVPIIEHVSVVQCITGLGYVLDFSNGSGRGGIGMHNHIDNNNGGLSVATFAPSAMIRPIAWS